MISSGICHSNRKQSNSEKLVWNEFPIISKGKSESWSIAWNISTFKMKLKFTKAHTLSP